ncbi:MAG: element excision factor XisH family protein [Caldilineaceae bacterium]
MCYNRAMPARDALHNVVKEGLIKQGWRITQDPFLITFGSRKVFADMGAERLLAAERDSEKIVVEVKSFLGLSKISDLERALGQYLIYRSWLSRSQPGWTIYIAIDTAVHHELFLDVSGQVLIADYDLRLIVVNIALQEIVEWTS